jgi:hypothetical protein
LRKAADITLEDIYKAIEPDGSLFALRERGSARCRVNLAMKRRCSARPMPPSIACCGGPSSPPWSRKSRDRT